ncbi:MAG: ABC transporter permease [Limnochordia bacterium]|nr:ABC transporter permease [Limnochordia bacterium]MDD2628876.1 ABC transporter permease [Limnochordia bacterium]MDD4516993.1 ABC transporter permease [Limnochordia bacterium]
MLTAIYEHIVLLVALPVGLAILVAVPLGVICTRSKKLATALLSIAGIMQTIPSLALLSFMVMLGLGIGFRPAIVAIFIYALLPILRNTYTGIESVDPFIKKAAKGMGMTDFQCLIQVELPLAVPMILAGVRTSTTISIGTATLAAFVGGGGLGGLIVTGLRMLRNHIVLAGAIPAALLALMVDYLLGRLEETITPEAMKSN